MIFRFLAVKTHLGERAANVKPGPTSPFESFGVYVSCATHLQNNLSWLGRKPGRASERALEVSTYFQLVIARELLKSLGLARADPVANAIFRLEDSGFYPHGIAMSKVLAQFGSVVRDVMVKGRLNTDKFPYRLYRLEMTKDEPRSTIELLQDVDPEQAMVARELLRRAIFIELDDSRGKEGPAKQTMRWELRRIFNPAFGLSLRRESYLGLKDLEELQLLLKHPAAFTNRVMQSYRVQNHRDTGNEDLFGEDHG